MYNGIGLQTARGSGTNGYVQRNMSFIHKSKEKVNYKTEEDIQKLDALANRKPNQGILAHERKRNVELRCLEMQELMEDQGYPEDEIESKVALFRQMLIEKEGVGEKEIPKDDFGRPIVKESHQLAEANQEKNSKMREALGISQYFVEGSSLDPTRKAKEAAAAAAEEAKKKYTLIPDSSSGSSPDRSQDKEKDKKRKKNKSHGSREKVDVSPKKKKSTKKHKKDRSISPDVQKKKKSKKSIKEKSKYKSKSEASHKKVRSSSSSSASSSDSADDESSSKSSSSHSERDFSQEKHMNSSKQEKSKAQRRRSTSSEKIRYSKDARSRKDIYEAKKAKYKRKSSRTSSSSSGDSSPKQYYRLEPVLLKSKSKHKKSRQIIEIPKQSTFELKKYDKKKRMHNSSPDSSIEEIAKPESKRRKRSETPPVVSKHRSEREDAKPFTHTEDLYKSSRHSTKYSRTLEPNKHRNRSRSIESPHKKSHHRQIMVSDDESDYNLKKRKEQPRETIDLRESKSGRKHVRRLEESPVNQNGHSKHHHRSCDQEPSDSDESVRSMSIPKHKKHVPKSPSRSPPVYKNKKHVIQSPPYQPSTHRKKYIQKSPSLSPLPQNTSRTYHKSHKELSASPLPQRRSKRHDSDSSSHSPVIIEDRRKKKESVKTSSKRRERSISSSRSPSLHKEPKNKAKPRTNRSPSDSHQSDRSSDHYESKERSMKGWKSKGEVKEVVDKSCSSSPVPHRSRQKDKTMPESSHKSPKAKKGMTVIVESFQITPPKETSQEPSGRHRDSGSVSPNRMEPKKHKKDRNPTAKETASKAKETVSKMSPMQLKQLHRNSIPQTDLQKTTSDKTESSQVLEVKVKRGSIDVGSKVASDARNTNTIDAAFAAPKNSWNVVSNADDSCSIVSVPVAKVPSMTNTTFSEIPNLNSKNKERVTEISRSRSRSVSLSDSERSSRSRSYGRREKSYSRSYSKSRSRSHSQRRSKSRSPSRDRSHSKSYSRSRSISIDSSRSRSRSYSSRSRSRSAARSPSIPRRRGSPSFLDKRRITSARKRPVPYRRPSPSSPSSGSSWSYRSSSPTHPLSRGNSRSPRSQSWSPVVRHKFQIALNAALR